MLYVALGTKFSLSPEELTGLALGLELSGLPFFWALKKAANFKILKLLWRCRRALRRVKDRGFVWKSWAPQLKVLMHQWVDF